ncbi:membrane-associated progesterone-binding protein 4 [Prunus yedoensis var. nudiflora]|uniref:Membrane-associated progesterone-binding protein 4 n=1 Tax=Prunus yedoensis var. nudiflora TaxID=2094558 RepID=A0A314UBM2_PRUYE|nr:membrane-associated progesterone-binding protein 4 [Prunus yedoensis var. nudiflora]
MAAKLIAASPFVGIAVFVSLVALVADCSLLKSLPCTTGLIKAYPFIRNSRIGFRRTKGKSHYGEGGGYNHFSGRDASRAFVSGNFTGDGLTDSLRDLSSTQVKSVVEWRDFYFRSYTSYYDSEGNPTKYLKGVEAKAARGAQLLEKQKNEEAKQPSCNSRWSQDEGGEVWCDEGVPRLVQRPLEIALTGKMSKRCACFKEDQLDQSGLEVYEGCDFLAKTCRV